MLIVFGMLRWKETVFLHLINVCPGTHNCTAIWSVQVTPPGRPGHLWSLEIDVGRGHPEAWAQINKYIREQYLVFTLHYILEGHRAFTRRPEFLVFS